ncbi:ParB family chromosome partitioning protein [Streptomyces puniciscabiei]|uniref:ParB family chromosome partitioning protein n=1 Tax=Streptomyces puniciscabiei TaxID=164348 RepID=A0A542SXI1_9ACTN|nr:ParB/RepB/Spo0J family partition protein [Streptomyces puniciscabiei]TQK79315.1 ParB family chromosome partitioning protein [Streptomyces puniciscabiei]
MSKADQLGAGRFGGGVRSVSARRQAVAAATGVPTEGVAPPTELPPHRISLNPDNPRSSLGDLTDLAGSLKTHGQKQAITVMNRDAYVKANPEREADLEPDTTHVVIDGSSRLAAAREAHLPAVKVMVSDDQGTNSEELLESALVANIHRSDLGELDEARALRRLLAIHGSQTALSKRLHRSQGWVSQRLALLNLTPELQSRIGEEPIDLLRAVANKPAAEQEAALQDLKAERARKEEDRRGRKKAEESEAPRFTAPRQPGEPEGYYAVIGDGEPGAPAVTGQVERNGGAGPERRAGVSDGYYGVIGGAEPGASAPGVSTAPAAGEAEGPQPVPEPRTETSVIGSQADASIGSPSRRVPYDEPGPLAMLLDRNIDGDDTFFDLLRFLCKKGAERDPARLAELARSFAEQAAVQGD